MKKKTTLYHSLIFFIAMLGIVGSVYSQNTAGTPIQGTDVGLDRDPGGQLVFNGPTNSKGQVTTTLEKGKYKLILSKVKVKEIGVTLKITPQGGDTYSLPFETTPLAAKKGIAFKMKSKGTVLVTIFDRGEITEKTIETKPVINPTDPNPEPETQKASPDTIGAGPQKAINTSRSNIKHPPPGPPPHITEGKPTGKPSMVVIITLGGGTNITLGTSKTDALLPTSAGGTANVYFPILGKGFDSKVKKYLTFGVNVGGSFTTNVQKQPTGDYKAINIIGQSSPPTLLVNSGSGKSQNYIIDAGPQLNFSTGGFMISPILNMGYMNISRNDVSVKQTTMFGILQPSLSTDLYSQKITKGSGLAVIPKLRLAYFFGKSGIGMWAEGAYTHGPSINVETTKFIPNENPENPGVYDIGLIQEGTYKTTVSNFHYSGFSVNAGICFAIRTFKKQRPWAAKLQEPTSGIIDRSGEVLTKTNLTTKKKIAFSWTSDYHVDNQDILNYLGTQELIIKKGDYPFDSNGDVVLPLAKQIKDNGKEKKVIMFEGIPANVDCNNDGSSCVGGPRSTAQKTSYYTVKTITEKGFITQIILSYKGKKGGGSDDAQTNNNPPGVITIPTSTTGPTFPSNDRGLAAVKFQFTNGHYWQSPVGHGGSSCVGSGVCFGGGKQKMSPFQEANDLGAKLDDREVIGAFTLKDNILEVELLTAPAEKSKNFTVSENIELDASICKKLRVLPPLTIDSGDYEISYSSNPFGSIKLKTSNVSEGKDSTKTIRYACNMRHGLWMCKSVSTCFPAIGEHAPPLYYCFDFKAISVPGHIEVGDKGNAWIVLEKDKTRLPIGSDASETFNTQLEAKYAKANKEDEKVKQQMESEYLAFSKTDDHVVSAELLAKVSKITGLKIVREMQANLVLHLAPYSNGQKTVNFSKAITCSIANDGSFNYPTNLSPGLYIAAITDSTPTELKSTTKSTYTISNGKPGTDYYGLEPLKPLPSEICYFEHIADNTENGWHPELFCYINCASIFVLAHDYSDKTEPLPLNMQVYSDKTPLKFAYQEDSVAFKQFMNSKRAIVSDKRLEEISKELGLPITTADNLPAAINVTNTHTEPKDPIASMWAVVCAKGGGSWHCFAVHNDCENFYSGNRYLMYYGGGYREFECRNLIIPTKPHSNNRLIRELDGEASLMIDGKKTSIASDAFENFLDNNTVTKPPHGPGPTNPNEEDMSIRKMANSLNSQVVSVTVKGSGKTTADGVPIVEDKTVSGTIQMMKGLSNAGVSVTIEQKESGDNASAITDEKGMFLMKLAADTIHVVSVNGAEYGKIKIVSSNAFPKELSGKVKSIDVKTKSYIVIIENKEYTAHYSELPPVIGSIEQYSESSAAQLASGGSSCERCVEMCPGVCFFGSSGYCRCYMKILK